MIDQLAGRLGQREQAGSKKRYCGRFIQAAGYLAGRFINQTWQIRAELLCRDQPILDIVGQAQADFALRAADKVEFHAGFGAAAQLPRAVTMRTEGYQRQRPLSSVAQ